VVYKIKINTVAKGLKSIRMGYEKSLENNLTESGKLVLNECRFWIGICKDDVLGDNHVVWNHSAVAFDLSPEIAFCSVSPEQRQILDWYLQV
jgi:hypothetical protein